MKFNIESITSGTVSRPPRIIMLGGEKIGKTTFAAGAPNPIFLPMTGEEGMDSLSVPKFPVCEKFADVIDALQSLLDQKHDFGTVVLDSASALEPIIWSDLCAEDGVETIDLYQGGWGKGYGAALYKWRSIMSYLDALRTRRNMASILIGHVKIKRFDDPAGPSYDQYQFDVNDRAANAMYRWCDAILFANTKVTVKEEEAGFGKKKGKGRDYTEGQRFLYTQCRPAHPGGGRGAFGNLPYELNLDWSIYQDEVSKASNELITD